jgi:hypothetical protein
MTMLSRGRVLLLGGLLVLFSVVGCTTTLLYNHADWLLTRQLDGYFDLSTSQQAFVSSRLDTILARHRVEALPRYEEVLQQVRICVHRGLTDDDLDWAFAQYDRLRADLFARFAGDGADFVRLVEEQQVSRVRTALRKQLAKQEGLLRESAQTRLEKRTERILSLANEWLGSLTRRQKEEIIRLAMAFPDTFPAWYAHQLQRNEQLVAVLEARNDDRSSDRLFEWLVDQGKDADPQFLEATHQLRQHIAQLVIALDRLATPEQRRHVLYKLDDLVETIHGLSRT